MKHRLRYAGIATLALLMIAAAFTSVEAAGKKNLIKVFMLNTGLQSSAHGKVTFVQNPAQSFLIINLNHMAPGTYDVMLNGAVVETVTIGATGSAKIIHRQKNKGKHAGTPLPYNPAGGEIEIMAAGAAVLAARIPATPEEGFLRTELSIDLLNMGVMAGSAEAEYEERFGRIQFEVELEGAAPGTYELLVDGVKVADIVVDASGRGEVEFDSRPSSDDDDGSAEVDLLLTFDPIGSAIVIGQAGADLFTGTMPLL